MNFTVSLAELPSFSKRFWQVVGSTRIFLFYGEMGAGKTTIIEELCAAKGVTDRMGSPTFSIINQYSFSEDENLKTIYHIDLYRLRDEDEVIQAGVEDCLYGGDICFIEWPQKAPGLFDKAVVASIFIEPRDETHRSINIVLPHVL